MVDDVLEGDTLVDDIQADDGDMAVYNMADDTLEVPSSHGHDTNTLVLQSLHSLPYSSHGKENI